MKSQWIRFPLKKIHFEIVHKIFIHFTTAEHLLFNFSHASAKGVVGSLFHKVSQPQLHSISHMLIFLLWATRRIMTLDTEKSFLLIESELEEYPRTYSSYALAVF